jgi:hypothetical protein
MRKRVMQVYKKAATDIDRADECAQLLDMALM